MAELKRGRVRRLRAGRNNPRSSVALPRRGKRTVSPGFEPWAAMLQEASRPRGSRHFQRALVRNDLPGFKPWAESCLPLRGRRPPASPSVSVCACNSSKVTNSKVEASVQHGRSTGGAAPASEGFVPASHAKTPAVAFLQSREITLWRHRGRCLANRRTREIRSSFAHKQCATRYHPNRRDSNRLDKNP